MAKRERSINWEKEEKQLLREIIKPYMAAIENKDLSTNTNKAKINAWNEITEKFNIANSRQRDKKQLLNQWKMIKLSSKKELSSYRQQLVKTGGGPKPPSPSAETLEIIEMIPQEFEIDSNEFDSDGIKDLGTATASVAIANCIEEEDNSTQEEKNITSSLFTTPKRAVKEKSLKKNKDSFDFGQSSYEDMHRIRVLENERMQKEHELRIQNMTEQHNQLMENLKLQNEILKKTLQSYQK